MNLARAREEGTPLAGRRVLRPEATHLAEGQGDAAAADHPALKSASAKAQAAGSPARTCSGQVRQATSRASTALTASPPPSTAGRTRRSLVRAASAMSARPIRALAVGPSPAGTALVEFVNDVGSTSTRRAAGRSSAPIPAATRSSAWRRMRSCRTRAPTGTRRPATGSSPMFIFGDGITCAAEHSVHRGEHRRRARSVRTRTSQHRHLRQQQHRWRLPVPGRLRPGRHRTTAASTSPPTSSRWTGRNFNGSVIYAMSKSILISAARGATLPPPVVQRLRRCPTSLDPFAAYHLSPSTVTRARAHRTPSTSSSPTPTSTSAPGLRCSPCSAPRA